jgi:hypothetical protein
MVLTGGPVAYRRPDGVLVVPIGCLKDQGIPLTTRLISTHIKPLNHEALILLVTEIIELQDKKRRNR